MIKISVTRSLGYKIHIVQILTKRLRRMYAVLLLSTCIVIRSNSGTRVILAIGVAIHKRRLCQNYDNECFDKTSSVVLLLSYKHIQANYLFIVNDKVLNGTFIQKLEW